VPALGWAQIAIVDCEPVVEKIVFTSHQADADIWVRDADGSNPVQLTTVTGLDEDPGWSPDATAIAFVSERSGNREIWTMDSDGNNQTIITNDAGEDYEPTWGTTPAGERIYFHTDRDGAFEIYWMTPTGGSQTPIVGPPGSQDSSPDLSASGDMVTFDSDRDTVVNPNVEIYSMAYDGTNVTRLTNNPAFDFDPVWSPDETKIAFVSDRDGSTEIYVMDADGDGNGDNLLNLTNTTLANETRPDWSPVPVP
jgi:TolB protein